MRVRKGVVSCKYSEFFIDNKVFTHKISLGVTESIYLCSQDLNIFTISVCNGMLYYHYF